MVREIRVKPAVLCEILEREFLCQIIEKISQQDTPFENGEKMVLIGSGLPMWEGYHDSRVTPFRRIASDLDFYIYEPNGEVMTQSSKETLSEKAKKVLETAVRSLGGSIGSATGDTTGSNVYPAHKTYTIEEIQYVLNKPETRALLEKFYNAEPGTTFSSDVQQPIRVDEELDVLCYPMSFLPPRPPSFQGKAADGKVEIVCDDTTNTIALKLARLMMKLPYNQANGRMVEKVTDIQDISDILHQRKAHGEPQLDMGLLKVLTLSHLAYLRAADERYVGVNMMNTCPAASNNIDVLESIAGAQSHLDQLAKRVCQERRIPVALDHRDKSIKEKNWANFRASDEYARIKTMIEEVDGLVAQMFPSRSAENTLAVTENERYFLDYLRYGVSQAIKDGVENPMEIEAIRKLAEDHVAVFERYPQLALGIANSWCVRPSDPFIAKHRSGLATPEMPASRGVVR